MDFCKTCGGNITRSGNYYICEYCGNQWEIDSSNDIHAVERANAWAALREGDFEKSVQLFEHILSRESKNHEAYWGRALALNGIVYVTDLNENKKVPTCNNITESSFIDHKDVQKAISLAPADIADSYRRQAEYIEKVRREWLEKASKEPAYDIFISYKDSDRENGLLRTQDSIDAQDLYNALVAEGYKVFFSRVSLRDKISEQYEPYIYNAIQTAKVMIVFGEKPEYFHSAWIKNEWTRFRARIEKGEKHKNALVVVYKDMNPADLPAVLKARQCLNAADMTFLSDLLRHIRRVAEESPKTVRLDKIQIHSGQIAKKASTLSINAVHTRQISMGAIAETSITEKQSLSLIRAYLQQRQWQEAGTLAEDVLFNNPSCAEAIWSRLLAQHQASCDKDLIPKLVNFSDTDYGYVEKVLNCGSRKYAESILQLLYASEPEISDGTYRRLLSVILPYAFRGRSQAIKTAFDGVIANQKFTAFQQLLSTLDSADVEQYINYYYRFAVSATDPKIKCNCLQAILQVDAGHVEALRMTVQLDLQQGISVDKIIPDFENLLKYTRSIRQEVITCLDWLCESQVLPGSQQCFTTGAFAKQLIRYYPGEISELKESLIDLSYQLLRLNRFSDAEYFLNLVLAFDKDNPEVYWAICLLKTGVPEEAHILDSDQLLRDVPEFNRYLTLVSEQRRTQCISLSQNQKDRYKYRQRQKIQAQTDTLKKRIDELTEKAETLIVYRNTSTLLQSICMIPLGVLFLFISGYIAVIAEAMMIGSCLTLFSIMFVFYHIVRIKDTPSRKQVWINKTQKEKYEEQILEAQNELRALQQELNRINSL